MYYLVGFWRRLAAELLDSLIIGVVLAIVFNYIFGFEKDSKTSEYITTGLYVLYATLLPIYWKGYIIGKRIMKIHIERVDGNPLTLWMMIKREVIGKQLLSVLTFGVAIIISAFMVGIREDKRSIHDFIAGTHVVKDGYEIND